MEGSETSGDTAQPWQSYHTVYTNAKAGMEGVDKEKVQRIVYEMSKGSKYFENEERKEAFIRQKIENLQAQCAKLTEADISNYQKVAEKRMLELEATRDLSRCWLHVDMDAFYAAVETLSNPTLKGKPMAVGSISMISTANYEARKFGVRAAMPGFIARKLCPELIFVPTDFKKYTYYSDLARKVFQRYDPNFTATSLDEAYLDVTEVCKERSVTSKEIAKELRACVYEETGLTCSAGVAPNRLLAKVCSDINKPNGQFVLPNDRMAVVTFISSLPIRKIGGIGKVTENILRGVLGISTCEQLLQKGGYICALFSQSTSDFFLSVGLGIGATSTPQARLRKSISNERTFSATEDEAQLFRKLEELSEMLSVDMQKEGLCGRTLTLKLKTASFEVRTRAVTLQKYISSRDDILKHAVKLLKAELPISLRLIGLRVSHFSEDKCGSPSDPTQKPITNFIASRDPKKSCSLLLPDVTDNDPVETPVDDASSSDYNEVSKVLGSDLCSLGDQSGSSSLDNVTCMPNLSEDEQLNSCQDETLLWFNDYRCSICGIELPPSFVEERQEHSDFHLAEKLQKEESGIQPRTATLSQRFGREKISQHRVNPRNRSCLGKKVDTCRLIIFLLKTVKACKLYYIILYIYILLYSITLQGWIFVSCVFFLVMKCV
ncbi:DNA polymerase kappa-like isoform X2 [Neltuma alba]|uniref:DNA polymerase kappa-like isoform X2 n=1 Tax=Neltuma alba TaxID=207710 RepID=UPI0010A3C9A2|nr:DNA polymerase kappa-like isoform X2 [Prosopis alba]